MPDIHAGRQGTSGALRLYPRGFLGKTLPPRLAVKPRPFDIRIRTTPVAGIVVPQQNTADANAAVEMLYAQYIRRAAATMSFEFREKILIVALDAFGTASFTDWYATQPESPSFGDTHQRFLIDTLHFIRHGRRNLPLESWASFLLPFDGGRRLAHAGETPDETEPTEAAEEFFSYMQSTQPIAAGPGTALLADVIQQWTSRAGGIEDLIGTLHLLFGNL
ncbi:hypothetical protein HDG34_003344 [Paraburkholderia sp. HC6.4b]|uniref:hypothetical protein n=1 Tax=unclassified Paraburkholderia TaxID=2615204 RepID=UPI001612EC43|nr:MULTISPECIES: hypothetical protein [unclassified Paraburkholderia]MBB5409403.1 hypothetical protein [Paraburkholderia sp. HC6.4b]MBB5451132.1 hypothetical protein [Paraburkholderia sp. Kb1A]